MIDFHSHILPGMDDGSKTVEMTGEMLQEEASQGVTVIAATPHFYPASEAPEEFLKRRREAISNMPSHPELQVLYGAEVAYFSGISGCKDIIPLRLEGTRLLLVEMPFGPWSRRMVEEICNIPVQLGLIPVLAHVDRYLGREQLPKYLGAFLRAGVYCQCNAESFGDFRRRGKLLKLLRNGYIHFLGSDCHNMTTRKPNLSTARQVMEKKLGPEGFARFAENAQALLNEHKK